MLRKSVRVKGQITTYILKTFLRVLTCPVRRTLAIEPSKRFPVNQKPFKGSKILFREPNKVTQVYHTTIH